MLSEAKNQYYIYDTISSKYFAGWKSELPVYEASIHRAVAYKSTPGSMRIRLILAEKKMGIFRNLKVKTVRISDLSKMQ